MSCIAAYFLTTLCLRVETTASPCETANETTSNRDAFGVKMLYPTHDAARTWTSAHWDDRDYAMSGRIDRNDPQGNSGRRGDGTLTVSNGVLTMSGEQPRLYIYPFPDAPWRDTELTVYYMRVA